MELYPFVTKVEYLVTVDSHPKNSGAPVLAWLCARLKKELRPKNQIPVRVGGVRVGHMFKNEALPMPDVKWILLNLWASSPQLYGQATRPRNTLVGRRAGTTWAWVCIYVYVCALDRTGG